MSKRKTTSRSGLMYNIHADCSDMGLTLLEAMKLAENRHAWRPAVYSLGCQCVAYWLSSLEP